MNFLLFLLIVRYDKSFQCKLINFWSFLFIRIVELMFYESNRTMSFFLDAKCSLMLHRIIYNFSGKLIN